MINTEKFYNCLNDLGVEFFTGVPDSLLKDFCAYISDHSTKEKHIISANEGNAVALAAGYNLASNKIPLVYLQNSGIGNIINPLLSLVDSEVYSIPMLIMIGWRGEPGKKDEPQHVKQGKVTLDLFDSMKIPYVILPSEYQDASAIISKVVSEIKESNEPHAIIVKKGTFEPYILKSNIKSNFELNREQAIKEVVKLLDKEDIIVSTTGMTSRELFEFREELNQSHEKDFLTVGAMGHANQIALGIALEKPNRRVFCIDGDGALLMHTGSLGIIGELGLKNFKHILINNGAHDSVGGQPTIGFNISFGKIAEGFNYKKTYKVETIVELKKAFDLFKNVEGSSLLEICVNKGARKDLGRPTISPIDNKENFKTFIQ